MHSLGAARLGCIVLMVPYASVGLIEIAFMGVGDREWVRRTLCAQGPVDPVSQSPLPQLAAAVRAFADGIQEAAEVPSRAPLADMSESASDEDMGEATSDVEALRVEAQAKAVAAAPADAVLAAGQDTPGVVARPLISASVSHVSSPTADQSPAAQDTQPAAGTALDLSGLGQ